MARRIGDWSFSRACVSGLAGFVLGGVMAGLVVSALAAKPAFPPTVPLPAPDARPSGVPLPDPALAAGFVPHRAIYDVRLLSARSGAHVANIRGQMLYEWETGCDSWTTNHRFNLIYEYPDSPATATTLDFSTVESFDGMTLDFTSRSRQDGEVYQETRGQGVLRAGETGTLTYSLPAHTVFDLPPGTVFPMEHMLDLLEKIQSGKRFFSSVVVDGGDEDGPVLINSFIGTPVARIETETLPPTVESALLESPAHRLQMAFFPLSSPDAESNYEMSFIFHENGVIRDVAIDYGTFSVMHKLLALEGGAQNTCVPPSTEDSQKEEE